MADPKLVRVHVHFAGSGSENGEGSTEDEPAEGPVDRTPGFSKIHALHGSGSPGVVDTVHPHAKEAIGFDVLAPLVGHAKADLAGDETASDTGVDDLVV